MDNILFIIVGLVAGYFYRDLRDSIKDLQKRLPKEKPEIGATPASYGTTKGRVNTDTQVGLVEPKTPEQMAWDADERLRQAQFNVQVKSRGISDQR